MQEESVITNYRLDDDQVMDNTIRPESIREYVGQEDVKENIRIFVEAAKMRNEPLDHVLLYGPPGLGKTTLAFIIAHELGTNIKIDLPPFTLVGATTRAGDLSAPLRDRFGIVSKLQYYTVEELTLIVKRTAKVLGVEIEDDAAVELAKRSRGTPRIANRLFKRVRDFALVKGDGVVNLEITKEALERLQVDDLGLDRTDHELLLAVIEKFNGGPVGVEALSSSIGEEVTTIEDVYEPYLLQTGLLKRTSRGRIATDKAYQVLGIEKK